ncbi:hypothetical protein K5E_21440 [Enterococcus thailandicus]|uniref:hypothetical protein n=1 Tax=Enterococcus thailandicus TaxID=417368 RepID=UPI00244D8D7A|nr:hypothetical protein [Enterococcus thailandicus]GMC03126.1 hypothetical protein K4E_06440 [Enterococcus thailandicus]GMC10005.1 hypothetical protein K5E_21440 [Enterococcus thailandicus]
MQLSISKSDNTINKLSDRIEIIRRTIPTWDITKTFGITTKDEWKKSGFQLVTTPQEEKDNKIYVIVKDKLGEEKLKVQIK